MNQDNLLDIIEFALIVFVISLLTYSIFLISQIN